MTLPQKKASVAFETLQFLELESAEGDRGPANAVIAKLAQAIVDQNTANRIDTAAIDEGRVRPWPEVRAFAALALGSATLWVVVILAISGLL